MTDSKAQATQYTVNVSVFNRTYKRGINTTLLTIALSKQAAEDKASEHMLELLKLSGSSAGCNVTAQAVPTVLATAEELELATGYMLARGLT